jgi:hypothetical protein
MAIELDSTLEKALTDQALRQGISPQELAIRVLRERLLRTEPEPRDDWECELLDAAQPWGVSLSNRDLSRESHYD